MKSSEMLRLSTLIEILGAAANTWAVDWPGFPQTGGIFLAAPPGQLKTFCLMALENVPGAKSVSDLTARELDKIHSKIESKEIRTLLFLELPKIYERRAETATNIMGHIRSLVDEGFTGISANQSGIRSRATVIAAMPLRFERSHKPEWDDTGMARRLIFSRFRLNRPEVIENAIVTGKRLKIGTSFPIAFDPIKMTATEAEAREMLYMLKRSEQATSTPLIMLRKIVSVLRWKNKVMHQRDNSMELIREFAQSMTIQAAEVEVDLV